MLPPPSFARSISHPDAPGLLRKRRFMDIVLSPAEPDNELDPEARPAALKRHRSVPIAGASSGFVSPTPSTKSIASLSASPTSATSPSAGFRSSAARANLSASQTITLDMLRPHFEKPLAQVAQSFGICVTLLKKICRKNGLPRWPHRQIIGLRKSIASMEQAIDHFEGARRDSYAQQLDKQRAKLQAFLDDPTKCSFYTNDDDAAYGVATPTNKPLVPSPPIAGSVRTAQDMERFPRTEPDAFRIRTPTSFCTPYPAVPTEYARRGYLAESPVTVQLSPTGYLSPPPNVYVPPLRLENRPMLPSLASVVNRRW